MCRLRRRLQKLGEQARVEPGLGGEVGERERAQLAFHPELGLPPRLDAEPDCRAEVACDDPRCPRPEQLERAAEATQRRGLVGVGEVERAIRRQEATRQRDAQRLGVRRPERERMRRRVVRIVQVPMLYVHATAPHEPGRHRKLGRVVELEQAEHRAPDLGDCRCGVVVAGDQRDAPAGE